MFLHTSDFQFWRASAHSKLWSGKLRSTYIEEWMKHKKSFFFLRRYRFTQIAVDPQIKTPGGKTYDVIFVGTGEWIEWTTLPACGVKYFIVSAFSAIVLCTHHEPFRTFSVRAIWELKMLEMSESIKFQNEKFSPQTRERLTSSRFVPSKKKGGENCGWGKKFCNFQNVK